MTLCVNRDATDVGLLLTYESGRVPEWFRARFWQWLSLPELDDAFLDEVEITFSLFGQGRWLYDWGTAVIDGRDVLLCNCDLTAAIHAIGKALQIDARFIKSDEPEHELGSTVCFSERR